MGNHRCEEGWLRLAQDFEAPCNGEKDSSVPDGSTYLEMVRWTTGKQKGSGHGMVLWLVSDNLIATEERMKKTEAWEPVGRSGRHLHFVPLRGI
jgi:hypothetical protein